MKYKGKEIKKHLMESIIHISANTPFIPPKQRGKYLAGIRYPDDRLYLGSTSISLPALQSMYGCNNSEEELIKKGKDYLVDSVLERYTVTQRAEPGVKVMFCKAHVVEVYGKGIPEDIDVFIPIFTCVSIPRHSVIYSSDKDAKRRASAGKITNILWCPTHSLIRCLIVPKKSSSLNGSVYVTASLLSGIADDNQVIVQVRTGRSLCGSNFGFIECAIRVEFDDYNPKTETTNTVYSIYEMEKYANVFASIHADIDYDYLARHIGYSVKIDDFDITPTTCSTGFHFFDSIDEAKGYISI